LHLSFAGTGTPKQTKGHGLSSTDEPSKSASLSEHAVGTLSSTSLGHNMAGEAVDGVLNESPDHLTSTTVMTGQAVAEAVKVQVNFVSAQPLSACLSGSQSVGSLSPCWWMFCQPDLCLPMCLETDSLQLCLIYMHSQ